MFYLIFCCYNLDIQFWKNTKTHKGLSLRTLYVNFFVDIIIFFYLLDENTSKLIIIPAGIEIAVSVWKILKTTKFKKIPNGKFPFFQIDHQEEYNRTTD